MALTLWRDYDCEATALPEMLLTIDGLFPCEADQAQTYFTRGVRRVAFDGLIDLSGDGDAAGAVRALILLRELTGYGIVIDWALRPSGQWRRLSHLYPPSAVVDAPRVAHDWRTEYHHGRCVARQGPGFIQIRDHRFGALELSTIDHPRYLAAVDRMVKGCSSADIPSPILHECISRGWVLRLRDQVCWLPSRPYRWSCPSMIL